jgi:hypothetical protein
VREVEGCEGDVEEGERESEYDCAFSGVLVRSGSRFEEERLTYSLFGKRDFMIMGMGNTTITRFVTM